MSPSRRRNRRHQLHRQQSRQQKQIASQLAELGGAVLSQPIFFALSDHREVTVSRSMPGVLSGHMDDSSWKSLCDKIDEALTPMTNMNRNMKKWCVFPLAIFVPLVLIILVAAAIVANHSMIESSIGESMNKVLPILFLVALVGSVALPFIMVDYSSRCRKKVNARLEKICYEASTLCPGVSFKVYVELNYMQVIVANTVDEIDKDEIDSKSTASTNSSDSLSTPPAPTLILTPAEIVEAKKWRTAVDEKTNKTYYFNEETEETSWVYPLRTV